jgi:hypothetical protein
MIGNKKMENETKVCFVMAFLILVLLICFNLAMFDVGALRQQFNQGCIDACERNGHTALNMFRRDNFCYCDDGHRFKMDVGAMWVEE